MTTYQFTAYSESALVSDGGIGSGLGCGDSFHMWDTADTCFTVHDDDAFLSGDSYCNENANDHYGQHASIEQNGHEVGNGGQIYAERYFWVYDNHGNWYVMIEVEQEGDGKDFFTFYEPYGVPAAGTQLHVYSSCNVTSNFLDYKCLDAGEKEPPTGTVKGSVWCDLDCDGLQDKGKEALDIDLWHYKAEWNHYSCSVQIEICNDSDCTLKLAWIDYCGDLCVYQTIHPGQSVHQHTYNTHSWVLIDAETGDIVELIDNPYNGQKITFTAEEAEPYKEGVTVKLIDEDGNVVAETETDANGDYQFDDVPVGNYKIMAVAPDGTEFTIEDAGDNDLDSDVDATGMGDYFYLGADEVKDQDVGLKESKLGSIAGRYFCDENDDATENNGQGGLDKAVAGAIVYLLQNGQIIADTVTDSDGRYEFTDLAAGTYTVQFQDPDGIASEVGKVFVAPNEGDEETDSDVENVNGDGSTGDIVLAAGENKKDVDAGIVDPGTASIGDTVFFDANGNGVFDAGDSAVENAKVELLDDQGNVLATDFTDAAGEYLFDGLDAGDYRVRFMAPDGSGLVFTTEGGAADDAVNNDSDADETTGETDLISLDIGEAERDIDAGLVDPGTASIGDTVFFDANGNGVFDAGDSAVENAKVELLDDQGNVLATDFTDGAGEYLFDGLDAGDYRVRFMAPDGSGLVFTTEGGAADDAVNNDSDADETTGETDLISLDIGEAERDIDAGLVDPGTASIGDTVFFDANGNGVFDAGDSAVENAKVELLDDMGNVLATDFTDAAGEYLFDGLDAGDYRVRFMAPDGSGLVFTTEGGAADDAVNNDSDADETTGETDLISLDIGEAERDIDAGLVDPGTAQLGNFVFLDANENGVFDAGDSAVENAKVELLDDQGNVLATDFTDAAGEYLFDGLDAGDYRVRFMAPAASGLIFTAEGAAADDAVNNDSDADEVTGETDLISLSIGESELDIDAGLVVPNEDPNAVDDAAEVCVNETVTVNVLANDTDPDGGTPAVLNINGDANIGGPIVINGTATVTDLNGVETQQAFSGLVATLGAGGITFDGSAAFDGTNGLDIEIGETAVVNVSYFIGDGQGGSDTGNIELTFCGSAETLEDIAASLPTDPISFQIIDETDPIASAPTPEEAFTMLLSTPGDTRFDGLLVEEAYCLSAFLPYTAGQGGSDITLAPEVEAQLTLLDDSSVIGGTNNPSIPAGEIDNMINWILNQDFNSAAFSGQFVNGVNDVEVQAALWSLTDNLVFSPQNLADIPDIETIRDLALANGDFVAGAGDKVGLYLAPTADAIASGHEQPFVFAVNYDDIDCIC